MQQGARVGGEDVNLVRELVHGKEGSTPGQTKASGPGAKCEECHVIILDTVHCSV